MRIAIVGGNGTLGRPVTAELARGGHEVRVLSRRSEFQVDLTTGAGLTAALAGCDAVVDASNAQKNARAVLVDGSRRLLAAAAAAGVAHHVCVSIVGCDQIPVGYYKVKTEQEKTVTDGPVPWTIVQATQFHELAATALAAAARFRILPVPRMKVQTIAAAEVARAVAAVATALPVRGRVRGRRAAAIRPAPSWPDVAPGHRAQGPAAPGAGPRPARAGAAGRRAHDEPAGHSRHHVVRGLASCERSDLGAGGEGTLRT